MNTGYKYSGTNRTSICKFNPIISFFFILMKFLFFKKVFKLASYKLNQK